MQKALCPGGYKAFMSLDIPPCQETMPNINDINEDKKNQTMEFKNQTIEFKNQYYLTESGEIYINKKRYWKELNLAWWMNNRSDIFYNYFLGDKESLLCIISINEKFQ